MDPLVFVAIVITALVVWVGRGYYDEQRALAAMVDESVAAYRHDTAVEAARVEAKTRAAIEAANLAFVGDREGVVYQFALYRKRRREGSPAA